MQIPLQRPYAFIRAQQVPFETEPNSWYSVEQGKYNQIYITDEQGAPTYTTAKITPFNGNNAVTGEMLAGINSVYAVETITQRDAYLQTVTAKGLVFVLLAKPEIGVSGGALYYHDAYGALTPVQSISKFDFEVYWENVVDRPRNSVEEIENTIITVAILYNLVMQLQDDITDIEQTPRTYSWSGISEW